MANVLKKFIINGTEYEFPSGGGGGGNIDVKTVDALIDARIGNYDSLFRTSPGFYKILNDITDEDELGLTGGDSREDIVEDATSMNKISHGRTVMAMVASSSYALNTAFSSEDAIDELVSSWVSMSIIANNSDAMEIVVNNSDVIDAIVDSPVAMDAILGSDSIPSNIWYTLFNDSTFATTVYNSDTYLEEIANNPNALNGLIASSLWSTIMADISKLNIFMANDTASTIVIKNTPSEELRADVPLRSIIVNNKLDTYLAKDDRAYNGVITFDINAISNTTFKIARYWYNAVTSTWKYSIDGGERTSQSVAASTTALSIDLGSTGNHTVVVKPDTYAVWRARQMGNRNTNNYWNNTPNTIKFSIRNLPGYAFMESATSYYTNYFMYYTFYACTSLTGINIKIPTGGISSGGYYMSNTFQSCSSLASIEGVLVPKGMVTAGTQFMYYTFQGCTSLTNLPKGLDFSTITSSINTYFLYYFCNGCTSLRALPKGMKLPPVGNSTNYLYRAFYNCTALGATAPTEDLKFINAATQCFSGTSVATASPSAGSSIPVHRE